LVLEAAIGLIRGHASGRVAAPLSEIGRGRCATEAAPRNLILATNGAHIPAKDKGRRMLRHSLDVLRQRYVVEKRPLEASVEQVLRADSRSGARAILSLIDKRRFENRSEGQRLRKMLRFETALWESGLHAVAGVDEAGMSPLAGPVSAAAVVLKPGTRIIGIDDSKKLDAAAREELAKEITEKAEGWMLHSSKSRKLTRSTSIGQVCGRCSGRSKGCDRRRNIC
jgi:hypothetical protein